MSTVHAQGRTARAAHLPDAQFGPRPSPSQAPRRREGERCLARCRTGTAYAAVASSVVTFGNVTTAGSIRCQPPRHASLASFPAAPTRHLRHRARPGAHHRVPPAPATLGVASSALIFPYTSAHLPRPAPASQSKAVRQPARPAHRASARPPALPQLSPAPLRRMPPPPRCPGTPPRAPRPATTVAQLQTPAAAQSTAR